MVRLYVGFKSLECRWRARHPSVILEEDVLPIQDLINNSRLVVHSYDSTGILETLALNIPTMCFWRGGFECILPSARPYYELLRTVGIFTDTPEHAATLIAERWENVDQWWLSAEVQSARQLFCNEFSRKEEKPVRMLKRLLLAELNIPS